MQLLACAMPLVWLLVCAQSLSIARCSYIPPRDNPYRTSIFEILRKLSKERNEPIKVFTVTTKSKQTPGKEREIRQKMIADEKEGKLRRIHELEREATSLEKKAKEWDNEMKNNVKKGSQT